MHREVMAGRGREPGPAAAAASVVMLMQAVIGSTAAAASDEAPPAGNQLEEIVVTARRAEESLQRVPISVSAISAEDLAERSIESLSDLGQSVPNLLFGERGASGRGSAVVYIRGVGQADVRPTYDPAVGIYIDGVFLGRMQGNDLDTMDVERVEVLRGPQGTLFGKNTSGGAVNIVTRQPDLTAYTGKVQVTGGSRSRFDALASLNVPLVMDKVALLVAASRRTQDGYGTRADGQSMANTDRTSGRLALRLQLSDAFSALFAADALTYDETNSMFKLISIYPAAPPVALINRFTPVPYDERWLSQSDFFNYAGGPNSSRGDLYGSALTLTYDLGAAQLKSISAYRDNVVHSDQDADLSPVTILDEYDESRQRQFSQEFQASGTSLDERLGWVLGLYYFDESVHNKVDFSIVPALLPIIGNASFSNDLRVQNESYAAFGQSNYALTDQLRLTTGLRYTRDRKEVDRRNLSYPSGIPNQPQAVRSATSDDVSTRVGLDYQWTPRLMTYLSAAKGYKAGGFNGRASSVTDFNEYDPESVWTYELGLRSDFFARRVRFNATAFYSDYSDLQLQISGSTTVNGAPAPFNVVTNVPQARIVGGEVELTVIPVRGLELSVEAGFTDARYTELPTDAQFLASQLIDRDSKFVYTPETSVTLAAEYTAALNGRFELSGRVDYAHKSTIDYDVANSPLLRQKPYGLLNARLTLGHLSNGLSLSLFGTNLTDERYFVGGFDDADTPNPGLGFAFLNMAPPREYGVSAQWRF
jgi:iron complex outermembrane receptor protein